MMNNVHGSMKLITRDLLVAWTLYILAAVMVLMPVSVLVMILVFLLLTTKSHYLFESPRARHYEAKIVNNLKQKFNRIGILQLSLDSCLDVNRR